MAARTTPCQPNQAAKPGKPSQRPAPPARSRRRQTPAQLADPLAPPPSGPRTNNYTALGFSRAKPSCRRYGKYGYGAVVALASSRRATCSAVNDQPIAPRLSRNWLSLRAPIRTEDTLGRPSNQFNATCG